MIIAMTLPRTGQVLSLLHTSLGVDFPDPFGTMAAATGFISIDTSRLLVILELDCIPEFGFYSRWLAVVIGNLETMHD